MTEKIEDVIELLVVFFVCISRITYLLILNFTELKIN